MARRLEDKVCVITGTGGAIGAASALAFAREGALVVGCDLVPESARSTATRVRSTGGTMVSLEPCDLSSAIDCTRLIEFALVEFGRIDVLFNNASKPHYGWMTDHSDEHWYKTIDHELHNVYLLCKAAWPSLRVSGGNVINMGSISGWIGLPALPGIAHSAAKAGVIGLTRHLAMEGREARIRANSISPGVIGTPAVLARAEDPEWAAAMTQRIMGGRFGTPEEVAAVALFLASAESSFVNGTDIRVDGGTLAW
ncbi:MULTISPECIES: SDR family NAD(P)-dependent oxidoreductase [Cupriavidus]|uniref:SDR family NAD(P)-dependent oxidoreductase n=1 Tax=Cupriavidus TaxID=106589 RepID=UPI00157A3F31|nr:MULTISPECIES: SDR family oxidoreductase [Cupriavidus]MBB1632488.1 oxidoreductase [Cupriavidus sp. UME77]NUA32111.1 SDR family oxidoreductase [Cupriavidus basilensis]